MEKILIIEDDGATRKLAARILTDRGYLTVEAENGMKGLEMIAVARPSLVLCDVQMPELSGYQTIRAIRENPDFANLPFIFISARNEKRDITHGLQLKADGYITKPFTAEILLAVVDKVLGKK